jgi:hypothetical protein
MKAKQAAKASYVRGISAIKRIRGEYKPAEMKVPSLFDNMKTALLDMYAQKMKEAGERKAYKPPKMQLKPLFKTVNLAILKMYQEQVEKKMAMQLKQNKINAELAETVKLITEQDFLTVQKTSMFLEKSVRKIVDEVVEALMLLINNEIKEDYHSEFILLDHKKLTDLILKLPVDM